MPSATPQAGQDFVILNAEEKPGGTWLHGSDSLTLISPAEYSSLPGWQMPPGEGSAFQGRDEVIASLSPRHPAIMMDEGPATPATRISSA